MTRLLASLITFLIVTTGAFASGPSKSQAPAASAPFTWTGFYVGGAAGTVFNGGSVYTYDVAGNFEPKDRPRPTDYEGYLFGAHAGYLYQMQSGLVLGAEAGVLYSNIYGNLNENAPPKGNDYRTRTEATSPIFMATARVGWAMDRIMAYGKAGWAWTQTDFEASFYNKDGPGGTNGTKVRISDSFDWDGMVWGGGIEYALTKNITFGVEYLKMDFGSSDVRTLKTTNSGITTEKLRASNETDSVIGRLNFKF